MLHSIGRLFDLPTKILLAKDRGQTRWHIVGSRSVASRVESGLTYKFKTMLERLARDSR